MSTPHVLLARRLTAGLCLFALPLGAAVGCGQAAAAKKQDVGSALQKASANLRASGSTSVTIRLDDASGALKKASTAGADALKPAQADLLTGGTISITIDPAAGKTLQDLQNADPKLPTAEQLKLANVAFSVQADGGDVAQLRIVAGDLYVNVGVQKISDIAKLAGSSTDVGAQLDDLAASAPEQLRPLVTDVKAGKWIKLPLAEYADQLKALGNRAAPSPSAAVDTQKLGVDLLAAVQPFVSVSDASGNGTERVLDVKVQAKQALKAVLATVKAMQPAVADLGPVQSAAVDKIADGTLNGQVFLDDDHLKKITLDLQSAVRLAPPGATPAPDLTGSLLTIDVNDAAGEVTVPKDVSPVDVGALVKQLLGTFGGALPGSIPS